ncbi:MAG: toxin-antitoxin system YwqK family antitoxin [Bacteroidetes bacterium]|nr:toxin-antitoxin system YwqK family antitoxin [Bacteroidota bacterium]
MQIYFSYRPGSRLFINHFLLLVLLFIAGISKAQLNDSIAPDGYIVFKYPGGQKSSEGTMKNGKPDGYWKTYYEDGLIKSEGNRVNYQLDGVWKFYDDSSHLQVTIEYKNDRKNGLKTTFHKDETIAENFVDDVKQGNTTYYYPDGKVRMYVPFENGLEQGISKEYAKDGTVITYIEYKKGFMVSRERINRKDRNGLKQGRWKFFFDSGLVKLDGVYKDDKRNGYFKEYDENGQLLTVKKYQNDVEVLEAPELASLSVKTDYYPTGQVKTVASYNGDEPEGVRREYAVDGKIIAGYIFHQGKMTGEGIVDEEGTKDGPWKEYYEDGSVRSVGTYDKGNRVGEWKFYYPNGKLEEQGKYNKKGKTDGTWDWYYEDGTLQREQSFINGLEDGEYLENDEAGKLIVKGQYADGLEEGEWTYDFGQYKETGNYHGGLRNGKWKSYFADGTPRFEGEFIDDNMNGKVTWYWPNGKIRETGSYLNGSREGDWSSFEEDGSPTIIISYKGDVEKRYDGVVIKPPFTE